MERGRKEEEDRTTDETGVAGVVVAAAAAAAKHGGEKGTRHQPRNEKNPLSPPKRLPLPKVSPKRSDVHLPKSKEHVTLLLNPLHARRPREGDDPRLLSSIHYGRTDALGRRILRLLLPIKTGDHPMLFLDVAPKVFVAPKHRRRELSRNISNQKCQIIPSDAVQIPFQTNNKILLLLVKHIEKVPKSEARRKQRRKDEPPREWWWWRLRLYLAAKKQPTGRRTS